MMSILATRLGQHKENLNPSGVATKRTKTYRSDKFLQAGDLFLTSAENLLKLGIEDKAKEQFRSAADSFAQSVSNRINNINTNEIAVPEIYNEYKRTAFLVEKTAKAYALAGDTEKSKKYWWSAANMQTKMMLEGIGDKDELKVKERMSRALSAIKAAKNSNDQQLAYSIREDAKGLLRLYCHNISAEEQKLTQLLR